MTPVMSGGVIVLVGVGSGMRFLPYVLCSRVDDEPWYCVAFYRFFGQGWQLVIAQEEVGGVHIFSTVDGFLFAIENCWQTTLTRCSEFHAEGSNRTGDAGINDAIILYHVDKHATFPSFIKHFFKLACCYRSNLCLDAFCIDE